MRKRLKVSEELKKKKELLKYFSKAREYKSLSEILRLICRFGRNGISIEELSSILNMDENLLIREILFLERQGKVKLSEEGKVVAI